MKGANRGLNRCILITYLRSQAESERGSIFSTQLQRPLDYPQARRFGLVGGLTFVALLASVEGGEILKALLERDVEGSDEVVKLPSGLSYVDTRIGGGAKTQEGDFVGVREKS